MVGTKERSFSLMVDASLQDLHLLGCSIQRSSR